MYVMNSTVDCTEVFLLLFLVIVQGVQYIYGKKFICEACVRHVILKSISYYFVYPYILGSVLVCICVYECVHVCVWRVFVTVKIMILLLSFLLFLQ